MRVLILLLMLGAYGLVSPGTAQVQKQSSSKPPQRIVQNDPFGLENAGRRSQNPVGLTFVLRIKDNQTKFHQGELIQLELSFASSIPKAFILDKASYDRSGRLDIDDFVLDHEDGTEDPLHDYFSSGLFGFIGGGLRGIPELSNTTEIVTADLNEWLRFDRPGRYRLYVTSSRVGKKRNADDRFNRDAQPVTSNIVEFDILPANEEWANKKLVEAISGFKPLSTPSSDPNRQTCRLLRFLGTKAAVKEMITRLRGEDSGCDSEYTFGLISSRHRDFVIRSLEQALSSPDQPITSGFVITVSLLATTSSLLPLPPYPEQGTAEQLSAWQAQHTQRRQMYDRVVTGYLKQLAASTPQKSQAARATSLRTLLDYESVSRAEDRSFIKGLIAGLPEVFYQLPLEAQSQILEYRWKSLDRQAMLPVLRKIYAQPENKTQQYEQTHLRSTALRRLFQVSAEEARPLFLDEIRRPQPRVTVNILAELPDELLPEVDDALVTNLENFSREGNVDAISALIERFATSAIVSRVKRIYEGPGPGRWACSPQASLLAYLLRVDPQTGGDLLNKALAARDKGLSRCYESTLVDVAKLQMTPEVEAAAMTALEENDPEMVSQASEVLRRYGSAAVENKLWRRLERWHSEQANRAEELRQQNPGLPLYSGSLAGEALIEQSLRKALVQAQAWLADPEKLKRLRELCLTESGQREVNGLIKEWNQRITFHLNHSDDSKYRSTVAQYEMDSIKSLKEKLIQFPPGTVFTWSSDALDGGVEEHFNEVKSFLETHGMKVEKAKP